MPDTTSRQHRTGYSFSAHGGSEQGNRQGDHIIKQGSADVWSQSYEKGFTTVRIFPGLNKEDPTGQTFDPYRWPLADPCDPLGYGDWIRRYPAVRNMGEPGVSFIQNDPANPQIDDIQMTPAWQLYRAIDKAVALGQDPGGWAMLLRGGANRGAQLSRPTEVYVVQCCVLAYKSKFYQVPRGYSEDDQNIVMVMGPGAGKALLKECDRHTENYQGDPADIDLRYANGDLVSLDKGRFVTWYSLSEGDPRQAQQVVAGGWQQAATSNPVNSAGPDQKPIGYGCYMEPTCGPVSAAMSDVVDVVRSKVKPWSDLFNFPTIEEQARLLADKFPAAMIEYAWQGTPEWIPDDVRRKARAAVSVAMPGVAPPPTAPQPVGPAGPGGWAAPSQAPAGAILAPQMTPPEQPGVVAPPPVAAPVAVTALPWGTQPNPVNPPAPVAVAPGAAITDPSVPGTAIPPTGPPMAAPVQPSYPPPAIGPPDTITPPENLTPATLPAPQPPPVPPTTSGWPQPPVLAPQALPAQAPPAQAPQAGPPVYAAPPVAAPPVGQPVYAAPPVAATPVAATPVVSQTPAHAAAALARAQASRAQGGN